MPSPVQRLLPPAAALSLRVLRNFSCRSRLEEFLLQVAVAEVAAGGDDDRLGVDRDGGAVGLLGRDADRLVAVHEQAGRGGVEQDLHARLIKGLVPQLHALIQGVGDQVEAALFLIEGRLKAEVGLLHLVADPDQVLDRVLALVQAAVHQGGVRSPVRVVHDVLEDLFHLKRRAALARVQDGGVDREGAGDLDAVDARDGVGLLDGQDLRALLACGDGGHEAGAAAADDADVHVIGSRSRRSR